MCQRMLLLLSVLTLWVGFSTADAQIRYRADGMLTYGNTEPFRFYDWTLNARGLYLKTKGSNFLQFDVTPGNPRIAGHGDQVVFFNTQSSRFNSIQVEHVYNYSDARAKSNIRSLSTGLDIVSRLRPVSYNFKSSGSSLRSVSSNPYTGSNREIGLLAQEVEQILPSLVYTDDEGRKLIDYTALIPVLIDAVNSLKQEVNALREEQRKLSK